LVVVLVSLSTVSSQQVAGNIPRTSGAFTFRTQLSPSHTLQNTVQHFPHLQNIGHSFSPFQNVVQYSNPLQNGSQLISPSWPFTSYYQATDNLFVQQQHLPVQKPTPLLPVQKPAKQDSGVEQARSFSRQQASGNKFFNIIPTDLFATNPPSRPALQARPSPAFQARPSPALQSRPISTPTARPFTPERPVPRPTIVPAFKKQQSVADQTPILRYVNEQQKDGSYTYGFESADGTYKIETRLSTGEVVGKYGYLDSFGQLKEVTYGAGNDKGFVPSITSSDNIPENVGISYNNLPAQETSRTNPPSLVKTRLQQNQPTPVENTFDYREDEVLTAFKNLMEVSRGFKPEYSPTPSPQNGFRPTLRTRTITTRPSTAGPTLFKKMRKNPKARGFSLSGIEEPEPSKRLVNNNIKVQVVNGKRRLMKRRRKPVNNDLKATTITTTTLSIIDEDINTIDTSADTQSKTEQDKRRLSTIDRRLMFPPRDFMERVRGSESKQMDSKTLEKKRFKVRRRKVDLFNSSNQRSSIPRSSSGRALPYFNNRADASLAGTNILPKSVQHTNAHQGHQNIGNPFVSDIDMLTGSYSISY